MILGTLNFPQGADYVVKRPLLTGWAVQWWNPITLTVPGNYSIFQEHIFGGYSLLVNWAPWIYEYSVKSFRLDQAIINMWAYTPGFTALVGFGTAELTYEFNVNVFAHLLRVKLIPSDINNTCLQALERYPDGYWSPQLTKLPPLPAFYP